MERLTRPDVDVTEYADKFLNTRLKGKEIDWKRTNDAGIDLLINAITCDEFSKDVFRQMARDLYGRLKQFEDTGLTPKEVTALGELFDYALKESKTLSEQLTLLKHIRELAAADKDGRVVVLPCKGGERWADADGRAVRITAVIVSIEPFGTNINIYFDDEGATPDDAGSACAANWDYFSRHYTCIEVERGDGGQEGWQQNEYVTAAGRR